MPLSDEQKRQLEQENVRRREQLERSIREGTITPPATMKGDLSVLESEGPQEQVDADLRARTLGLLKEKEIYEEPTGQDFAQPVAQPVAPSPVAAGLPQQMIVEALIKALPQDVVQKLLVQALSGQAVTLPGMSPSVPSGTNGNPQAGRAQTVSEQRHPAPVSESEEIPSTMETVSQIMKGRMVQQDEITQITGDDRRKVIESLTGGSAAAAAGDAGFLSDLVGRMSK